MVRDFEAVSYELAASRLRYEADTGLLFWHKDNRLAGYHAGKNYVEVRIGERLVLGHRLAWLLHYQQWPSPEMEVDHIDRNKKNNRIVNLRLLPHDKNCFNTDRTQRGGISYCKQTGKWKAYTSDHYKQIWLGRFPTREEAIAARQAELIRRGVLKC